VTRLELAAMFLCHVKDEEGLHSSPLEAFELADLMLRLDRDKVTTKPETNPPPKPGTGDVWLGGIEMAKRDAPSHSWLHRLMEERRELGIARYGTPLQYGNGRDVRHDLREELLDAYAYATQLRSEGMRLAVLDLLLLVGS